MNVEGLCYKCMQFGNSGGVCSYCGAPAVVSQSVSNALPVGTILHGSYLLGSVLGAGGFGITYIALHIPSGRRVAVKEFLPVDFAARAPGGTQVQDVTRGQDFQRAKKSFLREARTIYQLRGYAGIVRVEKLFEENNTAYYVMEYLDGSDLKHVLRERGGRLSPEETGRLLAPVFDALAFIHTQGIVHRDISPDNIFICRDGTVKLIDFGAAYAAVRERSQSMQLFVKRGYAPVEQYMSAGQLGPWTDEYAFAATIYHCLTGVIPPDAPERNYQDALVPPSCCGVAIAPASEQALLTAMSVRAQDRYPSVAAFRSAYFGLTLPVRAAGNGGMAVASPVVAVRTPFVIRWRQFLTALASLFRSKAKTETALTQSGRTTEMRGKRLALMGVSGVYAGNVFPIGQQPVRFGREASNCSIIFPPGTPGVSRVHCEISNAYEQGGLLLQDLGASFGTHMVDGSVIAGGQSRLLHKGDGFAMGNEWFTVVETED